MINSIYLLLIPPKIVQEGCRRVWIYHQDCSCIFRGHPEQVYVLVYILYTYLLVLKCYLIF